MLYPALIRYIFRFLSFNEPRTCLPLVNNEWNKIFQENVLYLNHVNFPKKIHSDVKTKNPVFLICGCESNVCIGDNGTIRKFPLEYKIPDKERLLSCLSETLLGLTKWGVVSMNRGHTLSIAGMGSILPSIAYRLEDEERENISSNKFRNMCVNNTGIIYLNKKQNIIVRKWTKKCQLVMDVDIPMNYEVVQLRGFDKEFVIFLYNKETKHVIMDVYSLLEGKKLMERVSIPFIFHSLPTGISWVPGHMLFFLNDFIFLFEYKKFKCSILHYSKAIPNDPDILNYSKTIPNDPEIRRSGTISYSGELYINDSIFYGDNDWRNCTIMFELGIRISQESCKDVSTEKM